MMIRPCSTSTGPILPGYNFSDAMETVSDPANTKFAGKPHQRSVDRSIAYLCIAACIPIFNPAIHSNIDFLNITKLLSPYITEQSTIINETNEDIWVSRVHELQNIDKIDQALDLIFDNIDNLMLSHNYNKVDRILNSIDCMRFSLPILIGLLTATLPAKKYLNFRNYFFHKVKHRTTQLDITDSNLLYGLE